ncbi:hypothetical protein C7M84_004030 [Penaeus vannamei]|uniref:Uncharacterized protein n=1 Tax=Penaeus vannamei TaxID=6689 RepID=A0A3R7SVL9_PENVA|nr:hypothetical protein C7M84_004030 [Penaeus vannamei]
MHLFYSPSLLSLSPIPLLSTPPLSSSLSPPPPSLPPLPPFHLPLSPPLTPIPFSSPLRPIPLSSSSPSPHPSSSPFHPILLPPLPPPPPHPSLSPPPPISSSSPPSPSLSPSYPFPHPSPPFPVPSPAPSPHPSTHLFTPVPCLLPPSPPPPYPFPLPLPLSPSPARSLSCPPPSPHPSTLLPLPLPPSPPSPARSLSPAPFHPISSSSPLPSHPFILLPLPPFPLLPSSTSPFHLSCPPFPPSFYPSSPSPPPSPARSPSAFERRKPSPVKSWASEPVIRISGATWQQNPGLAVRNGLGAAHKVKFPEDKMATKKSRAQKKSFIFGSFILCCLGASLLASAMATMNWFEATCHTDQATSTGTINFGLFQGQRTLTDGSTATHDLKVVCDGGDCMYSCGVSKEQRLEQLQLLRDQEYYPSWVNTNCPLVRLARTYTRFLRFPPPLAPSLPYPLHLTALIPSLPFSPLLSRPFLLSFPSCLLPPPTPSLPFLPPSSSPPSLAPSPLTLPPLAHHTPSPFPLPPPLPHPPTLSPPFPFPLHPLPFPSPSSPSPFPSPTPPPRPPLFSLARKLDTVSFAPLISPPPRSTRGSVCKSLLADYVRVAEGERAGGGGLVTARGSSVALFNLVCVICWAVQFHAHLTKNVLLYDKDNGWTTEGNEVFGYSFWLVVVAIFVHVANILIIFFGTYEPKVKEQMKAPESKSGTIMLY